MKTILDYEMECPQELNHYLKQFNTTKKQVITDGKNKFLKVTGGNGLFQDILNHYEYKYKKYYEHQFNPECMNMIELECYLVKLN